MKLFIEEPKESLESLILGIKDPKREMFHDMLDTLKDFEIERKESNSVKILLNDKVIDHYPSKTEFAEFLSLDQNYFSEVKEQSNLLKEANSTRIGACCGVGEDVYIDPNEE